MRLIEAPKGKVNPSTSTSALGNISTICPKSRKKDMRSVTELVGPAKIESEKESIRRMLENLSI